MLHNISRINIDAFYYIKETEIYQPTRPGKKSRSLRSTVFVVLGNCVADGRQN